MKSRRLQRIDHFIIIIGSVVCFFLAWSQAGKLLNAQEVQAPQGMVASAHPLATQAGLAILQQGGNAVDAAVAAALVLGVVEPNASGLGGGGFMVIRMAAGGEVITIDFRETAPAGATPDRYYHSANSFDRLTANGPRSVGVPGVVAGLNLALEKYGTLPLPEIIAPAVHYAREGFEISENLAAFIFQSYDLIERQPAAAAVFLVESLPPPAGSVLRNPDLAHTLEILARQGPVAFYRGELAAAIARTVQTHGGYLDQEDLAGYQPIIRRPVSGSYRGYRIFSSAPPTGGGTHLVELLNILECYDLRALGNQSADYLHLLAEVMKMVLADKDENMADPEFYRVPVQRLTSQAYADSLAGLIRMDRARFDYQPAVWVERESGSTTHLSVVDQQRNLVALTQSINSWFGSGIMVEETGILLNNHLGDFEPVAGKPNSIEPSKRPVSSIAPTLLLKDDQPFLTIGTPGGTRIISALAQIIVNIIDFQMDIDSAIEAPRIHAQGRTLYLEGRIAESVRLDLIRRGHTIRVRDDFDHYFGGAQGIMILPGSGYLQGGADSRRDGSVAGY